MLQGRRVTKTIDFLGCAEVVPTSGFLCCLVVGEVAYCSYYLDLNITKIHLSSDAIEIYQNQSVIGYTL